MVDLQGSSNHVAAVSCFLAIFAISCCSMFAKQLLLFFCQISPLLSSPLFCRWWNCSSPYIIWNMSWWSRNCEELSIITNRPYITFSFLLCYDALMLQVHDQMMIGMFLRPLLLLLLVFYILLFYRTTLVYRLRKLEEKLDAIWVVND